MFIWLWFCLLTLAACQTSVGMVDTPIALATTTLQQPIPTLTLTTKAVSPTATVTGTNTPLPSVTPTATATSTPTLTPTPVSTLPPAGALAVMDDLLTYNAYCELPCWWGATPGETTWEQVTTLLVSLSTQIYEPSDPINGVYETFFPHIPDGLTGHPLGLHVFYHVAEGTIQNINVVGGRMPTYYLQPILANYGPPDEVWIRAMPYTPTGQVMFRIALLYIEQGFSAHILTHKTSLADGQVIGCFSADVRQATSLFLWLPGRYNSFQSIAQAGHFGQDPAYYLPLEEATGMDVATFYNNYKETEGENCLSTPADIWEY